MKTRIEGVSAQMKAFDFFYGMFHGFLILQYSENLRHTTQRTAMSAAEGQEVVAMTLLTPVLTCLVESVTPLRH